MLNMGCGLEIALEACGVAPSGCATVSSLAWPWVYETLQRRNVQAHYAPIRETDLNLDPDGLMEALAPRTPVVILPHFAGLPGPRQRVAQIVAERGGHVIEEAALALGAQTLQGQVGAHGVCLFALHGLDRRLACRGSILVVDDAELAERARTACRRRELEISPELAAVGLAGMRREPGFLKKRQEIGRVYDREFRARQLVGLRPLQSDPPAAASRLYYPVLVKQRRRVAQILSEDWDVEVDVPRLVLPRSSASRWVSAAACLIGLPIHSEMEVSDAERVVDALVHVLG